LVRTTKLRVAVCLCAALTSLSCGVVGTDDGSCREVEINQQLKRVFYWGTTDWINVTPNKGETMVGIDEPTWLDPATILVFTGTWVGDDWVRGLFKIHIDDQTLSYASYEVFEFDYCVYSLSYQPGSGRLMIVYYDGAPTAASVSLSDGVVAIQQELVGPAWQPLGISGCGPSEDVVYYGRRPVDGVWGFFRRTWSGDQSADSLLLAIAQGEDAMQKFAVDDAGRFLYFGTTGQAEGDYNMRILRLDLALAGATPDTLLTRRFGVTTSLRPNPADDRLLLVQYAFTGSAHEPPDGKVLLLNTETLSARGLNVRTHKSSCRFTSNENVSWSPDGHHFAFSADAWNGEGGYYPRELWVYRNVR
jgi:hypothetical protein